ncbi:MAG: hypothetical protein M3X11_23595 [Acidobacteriota bacterium]|nr:hypothetical protein [Acidobacteriota bacterium]
MPSGSITIKLAATLPGEPLYAACGFQVIERIEATLPDGISLPITRMGKGIASIECA